MRFCLLILFLVIGTKLIAMEQNGDLAKLNLRVAELYVSLKSSNAEAKKVSFGFVNNTGVPLKIRGRFGGKDPNQDPPIGYICSADNQKAPQIFVLEAGQGIKFTLREDKLPLRVRVWELTFDPDSDMKGDKPISTSERNQGATKVSAAYDFKESYLLPDSYISIEYDQINKAYGLVTKQTSKTTTFTKGYCKLYIRL